MPDVFIEHKRPEEKETHSPEKPSMQKIPNSIPGKRGTNVGLLTTFCENPSGITIHSQERSDKLLLFLRRHLITNLPWILIGILLLLLPILLQILAQSASLPLSLSPQSLIFIALFYYLVVFGYLFANFLSWFYNIIIVTELEIIDIDFSDLVYHDVAATKANLVEDVNYNQVGFIRTLFNYGDLFVQTAGGRENIEALAVPKPAKAARIILGLIGKGEND